MKRQNVASSTQLGAHATDKGVAFAVWAPFAEQVAVVGSFNDWADTAHPMVRDDHGVWSATVEGAQPGQEYKFALDYQGKKFQKNDPRSRQLTPAGDNSVIVESAFDWGDDHVFSMPKREELVIYELHVGTFNRPDNATPGTFESAIEKLDYLKELGINAVELMPCSNMWMDRGWGYAPNYLFAVESSYGGRYGLMNFIKEAHRRGIAVIIDVVYNHLGPGGIDIWQFDGWSENNKGGIYFYNDWRSATPWGDTRLDYGRPEVRQYLADNARMWIEEFHADGLRLDSTHNIRNAKGANDDPGADIPEGWQVLQEITAAAHAAKAGAVVIAEDCDANASVTLPVSEGGLGFDAQWQLGFAFKLRDLINQRASDNDSRGALKELIQSWLNSDMFSRVIFSESHDTDANGRARLNEEATPGEPQSLIARKHASLAAGIALIAPGIPMLFQGQEFLEGGSFTDWQALDWEKSDHNAGMVSMHRHMINLRRNLYRHTAGLTGSNSVFLDSVNENVVIAHRWDQGGAGDDVIVIINLSNSVQQCEFIPPHNGEWITRFNSDWSGYDKDFGDTQSILTSQGKSASIGVGAQSVVILSQEPTKS